MKRPCDIAASFVQLIGKRVWQARLVAIAERTRGSNRCARAFAARHQPDIAIERLRRSAGEPKAVEPSMVERAVARHIAELLRAHHALPTAGRQRLLADLRASLSGEGTMIGLLHLARTASVQAERGFSVHYAGYADAAPFDLLISRQGVEAEIACDTVSAEEGRDVHRGAWMRLVDRIDPDLQTWLAAHPGRYLLKMTLPQGLRTDAARSSGEQSEDPLAQLHGRIRELLSTRKRADHDEAAVLRLDPLMLAGSQADELGLMGRLRHEFGHEAHLAVTASNGGVFVMAARAGREDEIAAAISRRLAALAPTRLTGTRPGILAMLVEDVDRAEWRHLHERLEIEGEARQFLTRPEARPVVAVTCLSRLELLADSIPADVPDGELRFRNPGHPAAKSQSLAPAVLSSV